MGGPRGFALGLGLLTVACSRPQKPNDLQVVGCYESSIGPYGWAEGSPPNPALHPVWVKLDSIASELRGGYAIGVPEGFEFGVYTVGAWNPNGRDSVVVQWASQHPGVSFRLAIEPNRLRGTGRFAQGDSTWRVVADRIPCGKEELP